MLTGYDRWLYDCPICGFLWAFHREPWAEAPGHCPPREPARLMGLIEALGILGDA